MSEWEQFVSKYAPTVWRTLYRLLGDHADAAECFTETFVCAADLSRHRRVRNFRALFERLATAQALDKLRERFQRSRVRPNAMDFTVVPSGDPGHIEELKRADSVSKLRKALGRLPSKEAEIFCLHHLNNMNHRQIGKEFGVSTRTAGMLLRRAVTKLGNIVEAPQTEKSGTAG